MKKEMKKEYKRPEVKKYGTLSRKTGVQSWGASNDGNIHIHPVPPKVSEPNY